MVDFLNSNLCGASPEMNDVFAKLEAAADEVISKLDFSASDAAAAFLEKQKELNTLTSKLQSIEIPELPQLNLSAEITNLVTMVPGTSAYTSALTKITSEFGSAVSALGSVGSLDSLVSGALAGGDPCSLVPNLQKVAGSDTVTQKPADVLQAAVNALGEVASKVTQNADLTSKIEEVKSVVSSFSVSSKEIEKDTGAFKIVSAAAVKTITILSGLTAKVAFPQVKTVKERKNVIPSIFGDGFLHKRKRVSEKFSVSGEKHSKLELSGTDVILTLKYKPVELGILYMYPGEPGPPRMYGENSLFDGSDPEGEKLSLEARDWWYPAYFGKHRACLIRPQADEPTGLFHSIATADVAAVNNYTLSENKLTLSPPFAAQDHPGNIDHGGTYWENNSDIHFYTQGHIGEWTYPSFKFTPQIWSDVGMNKVSEGICIWVSYDALDNYDPDYKTS